MAAMLITKTIRFRASSRPKLLKKDRNVLKSGKFTIFERNWKDTVKRLCYMRAVLRTDPEKYRYSAKRYRVLAEKLQLLFPYALYQVGEVDKADRSYVSLNKEQISLKITVTAEEAEEAFDKLKVILKDKYVYGRMPDILMNR